MREVFVTELARNILGPRDGIRETMQRDPLSEYVTGILAPIKGVVMEQNGAPETESQEYSEDGNVGRTVLGERHQSPALDPRGIPSSMGLSFFVNTDKPRFEVCITWSRYTQGDDRKWTRCPSHAVFRTGGPGNESEKGFGSDGKPLDDGDDKVEISYHYRMLRGGSGIRILMSIVNRIRQDGETKNTPYCIFQPQIRVRCLNDTKLKAGFRIPTFGSDGGSVDDLIYEGRDFMAVGRLTSAMWKAIDPENVQDNRAEYALPPFRWLDGDALPDDTRKRFTAPDVRTEYLPTFSVPTPKMEWRGEAKPEFSARMLADMYDPAKLRNALQPITDEYGAWIRDMEKSEAEKTKSEKSIVAECNKARARIADGIDWLCADEDARLAFCFANKVVDMQYGWSHGGMHLEYRPYQLAFILGVLESALNRQSKNRNVCDLLWVPTGTGKTEAYLTVVAAVMSYRRLLALKRNRTGAGVSVITRYTLRLLTIQQFRRTLAVVAAADCLRVDGIGSDRPAGWRPPGCGRGDHLIWGTTPFSIGLWVGNSLTPNNMTSRNIPRLGKLRGALDILENKSASDKQDPAQIMDCPACGAVLAVPDDGIPAGDAVLHFVVEAKYGLPDVMPVPDTGDDICVQGVSVRWHAEPNFATISINIRSTRRIRPDDTGKIFDALAKKIRERRIIHAAAAHSRPGYFMRTYTNKNGKYANYDFDIVCPNSECPLMVKWAGGSPCGKVHADTYMQYDAKIDGKDVPDNNRLETVITPFRTDGSEYMSDRVPLRAFTVDDQVYREVPSIVVATVDKFARLPFKHKTGQLFGNVDRHHHMHGYERSDKKPRGDTVRLSDRLGKPNMIIQDEFHLLEGPLGSMVGAYEAAVDFLSSGEYRVKYLAATATINRPKDHVRSILDRDVMVFPPVGIRGDRFFIKDEQRHQLDDKDPGRLYLGVCCPGKGNLVPLVWLWSSLLQTAHEQRNSDGIDEFWTLTGYFNTVRELAGAVGTYRQDIPRRMNSMVPDGARNLDSTSLELSSRTESTRLPSILEQLGKSGPDGGAPDSLFTTAMFGTGVDVSRLGLMIMNGQPKTATAYIQATGRVGRRRGALVVTLFGAARPRDMSYYEFFARHHLQLHRFVEPITVHPFASGTMARAAGPVALGMLRNMVGADRNWMDDARYILQGRECGEIARVIKHMECRAQRQPEKMRPDKNEIARHVKTEFDRWQSHAAEYEGLKYYEYYKSENAVVLGDQNHEPHMTAFENVPQSLRELEDEVVFET